jgi:flagellar hook-length control protein FliK
MIASATINTAAPAGAAAASFGPNDTASGEGGFSSLLDDLAGAQEDSASGLPPPSGFPRAYGTGVESRSRNGQLPVTADADDASAADARAADQQAADAGMALLLASLMTPVPLRPASPAADASLASATAANGADATSPVGQNADTSAIGLTEFMRDDRAIGGPAPPVHADPDSPVAAPDRAAFERELSRVYTPAGARAEAGADPRSPAEANAAPQPADVASGDKTATPQFVAGSQAAGSKPPADDRLSTAAADGAAAAPRPHDEKAAKSFARAAGDDQADTAATDAAATDRVPAASTFSQTSSGGDRNDSSASSSRSHVAADAAAAAPIRAARTAQAFARALDVHLVGAAAPAGAARLQQIAAVNAASATVPDDLSTQIVQAVRMQWSDGAGEARITLTPDYLGDVTVSLRVDQGSVTAVLHADSPAVRTWMQANEPLLNQALSEQGLRLERLVVSEQPPAEDGDAPRDGSGRQQEQPRRRRPRADAGGFEIIL